MECLQYSKKSINPKPVSSVLNLIISGMPSIQEDLQPYFLQPLTVLNLIISRMPSILLFFVGCLPLYGF